MSKPVILTGLRANNDLHIGNYLGALLPMVDMARTKSDEYQINLFVPDLHSFTTPIDHSKLQEQIMQNLRVFVASGLPLDNPNVYLYRQSRIPAHSELTVILNSFTYFGEMFRMTQFKDKAGIKHEFSEKGAIIKRVDFSKDHKNTTLGLFDYPVLMAADILLYGTKYVPVGDDQSQHLEFTRDIAERMNNKFGDLFVVPEPVKKQHELFGKDQGLRIKDLQDPAKKMSKSADSDRGLIYMTDTPDEARKKIMSATTDSLANVAHDPENQPGISNLLQIHALLSVQSVEQSADRFKGQTQYGEFKNAVADVVASFLNEFQAKLSQVDDKQIHVKLEESEIEMNKVASETLLKVQKAVGLRN